MRNRIPYTNMTARWVRAAQAGDPEAFDRLFGRVAVRVLLHLQDRSQARPALEVDPIPVIRDARRAAYRAFHRVGYAGEDGFLRWICRVLDHRLDEGAGRTQGGR